MCIRDRGTGSAAHVYNECGEEVLTYTEGVGWQEKETKAESQVDVYKRQGQVLI